jgi:DNA-binding transcriptional LysR family regulator
MTLMQPPFVPNFRQLLVFETVARTENVSRAAAAIHVSQPAVTQSLARLEHRLSAELFRRRNTGCYLTEAGRILQRRTERLFAQIDQALIEFGVSVPRTDAGFRLIERKLTRPQVQALLAIAESRSFAAAARALEISEASIHRAARDLERILRRPLFHRTVHGLTVTPAAAELARRIRLAVQELDRAAEEIAAAQGRNRSRIGLGLLPLASAFFVARALNELWRSYPETQVDVAEGTFEVLLEKLRGGGIDFILGPVRNVDPALGVIETPLFEDPYCVVVRRGHPLTALTRIRLQDLVVYDWVAPHSGSPRRTVFEQLFAAQGPKNVLHTSSSNLTRSILTETDRVTLLTRYEASSEEAMGFLTVLPFDLPYTRHVQVTTRTEWLPTAVQARFLKVLAEQARAEPDASVQAA